MRRILIVGVIWILALTVAAVGLSAPGFVEEHLSRTMSGAALALLNICADVLAFVVLLAMIGGAIWVSIMLLYDDSPKPVSVRHCDCPQPSNECSRGEYDKRIWWY
ncbi:MAG: hypothetical protein K2X81_07145 [Candidatus Obscuribacterales bacterium]|nr:hypothetical protein [Candidatus Obscuribacterales bacterium]